MTWLSQPAAAPLHSCLRPSALACIQTCSPLLRSSPFTRPIPLLPLPHTHHPVIPHSPPLIPHLPLHLTWVLGSGGLDHGGDACEAAEATPGCILRGGAVRTACILRLDAVVHVVLRVRGGMDCGGGEAEGGVGSREGKGPACPPGYRPLQLSRSFRGRGVEGVRGHGPGLRFRIRMGAAGMIMYRQLAASCKTKKLVGPERPHPGGHPAHIPPIYRLSLYIYILPRPGCCGASSGHGNSASHGRWHRGSGTWG